MSGEGICMNYREAECAVNWLRSIEFVLRWEGGYANDVRDPGGETMYGLSRRSYPDLDFSALTVDQAKMIYFRDYWKAAGCHELPWPVCLAHFDAAVNCGVGCAGNLLRQTRDATRYMGLRLILYSGFNGWERYGRAWARRMGDLLIEISALSES